ncbi:MULTISPECIES: hypothetical protein [Rhizobium]|uniref:Transmembrane protein n=1 Tax=Rhizobium tropici TaxID=398 RepID=A0A329YBY3_RHITR|nr:MULTISPECIES: hypothetical protein [Rhizobium]MBB3287458.1 hypothetical protein [Rhizobium sp. BK252]MBB3402198.1 hypothetical protein [Rhizobium sp. BK289]MBB3414775.1 hypothetical protein [Rhizobium sp. BK284]MBB3482664.1 hypothetical protein [Rhizobium sp. BK347]MDK4721741.1 hypothetical protein [Rhizobium sp. CNPSo 3968]
MPTFREVQYYLSGLWLLIRMDARGFQYLDISDRGMLRSFWAILWSLPSIGISWLWWQQAYLTAMPPETSTGLAFFLRLALVEAANWLTPPILAGLLLLVFRFGDKFTPIVVTVNWLFVPANYLNALLVAMIVFVPGSKALAALLSLALTMATIFALARILRMICGTHPLFVGTLTLMLLIPNLLLTDFLQRFLGVYPPG